MEIGTTITAERFRQLLAEIANECTRRKYYGSVSAYADRANNALTMGTFEAEGIIAEQTFNAIEEPMTAAVLVRIAVQEVVLAALDVPVVLEDVLVNVLIVVLDAVVIAAMDVVVPVRAIVLVNVQDAVVLVVMVVQVDVLELVQVHQPEEMIQVRND